MGSERSRAALPASAVSLPTSPGAAAHGCSIINVAIAEVALCCSRRARTNRKQTRRHMYI
ncbi:hypothetical protein E2C01_079588 [Portunus trituberculatus]|uniref:Uncharacterized protein n=1 Tax=Portunus trituberculatus TaxID=210409 RepID=A0A5B7IW11_PORTR|nr:hypothetical protein [Portunus trituberculatus]